MQSSLVLYAVAAVLLIISFFKSREKTAAALKKGWKAFTGILPQMLLVLLLIGLVLTFLTADTISKLIGSGSGFGGTLLSSLVGSVTLIPGFVAFPMAEALLKNGAGIVQIAAFISTLMMVGIVTLPMESRTVGRRTAVLRNSLAFLWSLAAAYMIGALI